MIQLFAITYTRMKWERRLGGFTQVDTDLIFDFCGLFFLIFADLFAAMLSHRLELCQCYCLRIKWERGLGGFTQVNADLFLDRYGLYF